MTVELSKGLIILGYQGIGKSTLGGWSKCIDLESGNFFVGNERAENWYIPYCQIAISLANQGYSVFVSSHREVREFFSEASLPENVGGVAVICPGRTLRDEWIEKLQIRYDNSKLLKDYKALMNAKERFDDNIVELCSCGLKVMQINAMDYNLKNYVYYLQQKLKKDDKVRN